MKIFGTSFFFEANMVAKLKIQAFLVLQNLKKSCRYLTTVL